MAIVDPEYKFTCIDVGGYGKNSDGGIFEASVMGRRFANGTFNIPPSRPLPGEDAEVPCVLIGDEAFTLSTYLMRPFPYRQSRHDYNKENFNYHLCIACRVVENAFGILAHKWRLFFRPLEVKVETATKLVKAACVLHNLLRIKKIDQQFVNLQETIDRSVQVLNNLPVDGRRAINLAFNIREKFVTYFNNF
nr:uncharacterized protein LOC111419958 [Onthophagus taurus]